MDPRNGPAVRMSQFLLAYRQTERTGLTASELDEESLTQLELRYQASPDAEEVVIGLRAEIREGRPVMVLYDHPDLRRIRARRAP